MGTLAIVGFVVGAIVGYVVTTAACVWWHMRKMYRKLPPDSKMVPIYPGFPRHPDRVTPKSGQRKRH